MAERSELLWIGDRDRVRARQQQPHCIRPDTGTDPTGLQRACYRRSGDSHTAGCRTSGDGEEVSAGRSHCLPRLRQAFFHAGGGIWMTNYKMTPRAVTVSVGSCLARIPLGCT